MLLPLSLKRILPFIVHEFLNPCSLRTLLISTIQLTAKLSVIDIPESFVFCLRKCFSNRCIEQIYLLLFFSFVGLAFLFGGSYWCHLQKGNVILSFIKLATMSSVISSLFSSNPWNNIQFLLEYCSWSSLSFPLKFQPYPLEY